MLRVTGLGLVEGGSDGVPGIVLDRACQPLGLRFRPGARDADGAAAARWGDDVVRAAHGRIGVVDGGQGRHPLAPGLLSDGQAGAEGSLRALGRLAGGFAQMARAHDDALAVHGQHQ